MGFEKAAVKKQLWEKQKTIWLNNYGFCKSYCQQTYMSYMAHMSFTSLFLVFSSMLPFA
jgi:hypothetical protein